MLAAIPVLRFGTQISCMSKIWANSLAELCTSRLPKHLKNTVCSSVHQVLHLRHQYKASRTCSWTPVADHTRCMKRLPRAVISAFYISWCGFAQPFASVVPCSCPLYHPGFLLLCLPPPVLPAVQGSSPSAPQQHVQHQLILTVACAHGNSQPPFEPSPSPTPGQTRSPS